MTARPRPTAELTETVQRILAQRYPGQIPAVVIERAVRQMAARDRRKTRTERTKPCPSTSASTT